MIKAWCQTNYQQSDIYTKFTPVIKQQSDKKVENYHNKSQKEGNNDPHKHKSKIYNMRNPMTK